MVRSMEDEFYGIVGIRCVWNINSEKLDMIKFIDFYKVISLELTKWKAGSLLKQKYMYAFAVGLCGVMPY